MGRVLTSDMGMCRPNRLVFHKKSYLRHESHFGQKSLKEGLISRKLQKIWKISHFRGKKKRLEMGPNFWKLKKKKQQSNQLFCERGKSFSDLGMHTPSKNDSSTPHATLFFAYI